MIRLLYRLLVLLHPRAFARRFGEEMLWIFDQQPSARLIEDVALSLLRQWVARTYLWIYAAAIAGAGLTMSVGLRIRVGLPNQLRAVKSTATGDVFILLALAAFLTVAITAIGCVAWFQITRRLRRA